MAENVVVKELCEKEHKRVNERLDHHESWLGEHEKKIDRLDRSDAQKDAQIEHLCKQMSNLTKAIWGLVVALLTTMTGFFVFAVEKGIFK